MSNRITLDQLPKRYQDQVAQEIARHPSQRGAKLQPIPEPPPAQKNAPVATGEGKARLRQDRKGPNKTEAAFFHYLHACPNTRHQMREGITLKLGNGVRYTPDFTAEERDVDGGPDHFCCYEVKGFLRDDAAVKVKVAASLFPLFEFYLATKRTKKQGGGWSIERVLP